MPASVLRRRPAEIVPPRPAPLVIPRQRGVQRLPPTPAAPSRRLFQRPPRRPLPAPYPVRGRRTIPLGWLAAVLVFVGLFSVAAGLGAATGFDLNDWFRGPDEPPPHAFPVLDPSTPERLTIPSIKVKASIMNVGLATDGTVAVPPLKRHNEAGWFDEGPTPGQFGPALIVGHADTRTGPSIFKDLDKVKPGAKIEVLRRDNTVAVFEVNSVEHYGKAKLPVQRVYGDYSRPSLRLVTCGGTWIGGAQGYADNIIVFAALVKAKKT
jgi:sortase (surface protein transpeptidase)